jgi:hypothetical protein
MDGAHARLQEDPWSPLEWKERAVFVQVFQGQIGDAEQMREALEDWTRRLAPGADGWLGSTVGVTDDGTLIGIARFESAEAARRNSGRAQQGEWFSGVEKLFPEGVQFHDCSDVSVARRGGSDEAGFVQVMQGRTADVARLRELTASLDRDHPDMRPDLLGYITALHDGGDGAFTQVMYFTSEAEARAGERGEMPADAAEVLRGAMELIQDLRYYDLREPWLHSAA